MTQVHRSDSQPTVLGPHDYMPGLRGIRTTGANAPGGAMTMLDLTRPRQNKTKKTPPMESVHVKACEAKARELYNEFMLAVHGRPLAQHETYPRLLLLVAAMFHVDRRTQTHAIRAMTQETWHISTNKPMRVAWNGQPYDVVEWKAKAFPTSVATTILQQCEQHTLADGSYGEEVLIVTERGRPQNSMRTLGDDERIIPKGSPWRKPTEAELAGLQQEVSIDGAMARVSGAGGGSGLLFAFGEEEVAQAPTPQYNEQPAHVAPTGHYAAPAHDQPVMPHGTSVPNQAEGAHVDPNTVQHAQPMAPQYATPPTPTGAIPGPAGGEYFGGDGVDHAQHQAPVLSPGTDPNVAPGA